MLMMNTITATVYTVTDKASLISRMTAAVPGDTVIVADGTYNWGQINFINNNGTSSSAWIVLKAQTPGFVIFTGTTYLHFKGTRVEINGFNFANGSSGTNAVISFRYNSSNLSNYCRVTNIVFDNYNTYSVDSTTENEWVGMYGTNNRLDHCTFINKYNARATVVVWYSSTTYPNPSISTYHRIDSNYFKGRSFQGSNGGETIRIGDSNSSRTDGLNTIEYNLFEDCTQVEPEIISNKSDFNVYRYNTFKNSDGGLTLRHGRYCSVYGNFFIVDNPARTRSYGVRVIDKGHKVYNNYFEGLLGNKNSLTSLRCPIILYNGATNVNDTADFTKASGYFPAENTMVAFNTIVNCSGGAGLVMGFRNAGALTDQPQGIIAANNVFKMTTGQAAYNDPANTLLTYFAEGNMYNAPNGLGLPSSTGFSNTALNFGARASGILAAPAIVEDAAVNTGSYSALLDGADAQSQLRSAVFDVGADELNGTGPVITYPLDSTLVGARRGFTIVPVQLISFKVSVAKTTAHLNWSVNAEINTASYIVEYSTDAVKFKEIADVTASGSNSIYNFQHKNLPPGDYYYRLKIIDRDAVFQYSPVRVVVVKQPVLNIYPNPARDFINVTVNSRIDAVNEIRIIDASPKTVKLIKVLPGQNQVFLEGLGKGMYIVELIQNGKSVTSQSFIVQ